MTASSPQRRIKQKFQAGHTENENGQGDLTDSSITRSLPYSITDCGYVIPWPSFPRLRSPVLLAYIPKHTHVHTNTSASQLVYINKTFLSHLKQVLRKLEHTSSLSGLDRDWVCHQTFMYAVVPLRITQRIDNKCLRIQSPRHQQAQSPVIYPDCISSKIRGHVYSCLAIWNTGGNVFILPPLISNITNEVWLSCVLIVMMMQIAH